jgi:hypothetical protein
MMCVTALCLDWVFASAAVVPACSGRANGSGAEGETVGEPPPRTEVLSPGSAVE